MNKPQTKINIYEMARRAGVSTATISRVINPRTRHKVAPQTLKRIDALIRKHGYTPNLAAQNLSQSATATIGVVFPYLPGIFYSNYYNHILAGVSDYLYDTDYRLKMLLLKVGDERWNQYDFRVGERVDGLLMTHWFLFFTEKKAIEKISVPCVVINDIDETVKTQFVGVDHSLGGRTAANHLFTAGHRRVAVLSGPDWSLDNAQRLKGFLDYYQEKGSPVDPSLIVKAGFLQETAYGEVEKLIRAGEGITAIFACNDQMAFGAIRRLRELGFACPGDISVMGFDDEDAAARFTPPLTTIHVPVYDLARRGVQLLMEHLQSDDPGRFPSGTLTLPTRLVERGSVTPRAV